MRNIFSLLATLALVGCATATYMPPAARDYSNRTTVPRSFDQTWEDLVGYASETFFAIDNFEKASGLLTLSFGSGDAARFVDCGHFSGGPSNYNGPYVRYVQNMGAALQGKMNLRVRTVGAEETEVTVNARYIFTIPPSQQPNFLTGGYMTIPGTVFTFDSRSVDTQVISGAAAGTIATRTCQPTGAAEAEILKGVTG